MTEIRTRFAPSPTGYLHIGGVRTALFCYLFAKQQGGKFILRIDDTDQTRNVQEALQPILDGLWWLGIEWDEGPRGAAADVPNADQIESAASVGRGSRPSFGPRGAAADVPNADQIESAASVGRGSRPSFGPRGAAADVPNADQIESAASVGRGSRPSFGPYAPYYQSLRSEKYQAAVDSLIASGHAYRDYAKPEEIQSEREAAQSTKKTFVYSRRFMAETPADCARFEAEGRQGVVRLKMPREGKLIIHDLIRGDVEFDWATEQDHVIQRADGSFIYHLANVVDDNDFKISHVIRAEEHLSNTPRQIFMIQSLGLPLPQYAHLPFVAEPGSKTKLSKRKLDKYLKNPDFAKLVNHGKSIADRVGLATTADGFNPVIVDFYRQVGYVPQGIINYLSLLGWALDDKAEFFGMTDMIKLFTLDHVNKAAASFDPAKLFAFEEKHYAALPLAEKYSRVLRYLVAAGCVMVLDGPLAGKTTFTDLPDLMDVETPLALPNVRFLSPAAVKTMIEKLIAAAGDRIKVSGDILDFSDFFAADDAFPVDEKAYQKRIANAPEAASYLAEYKTRIENINEADFTAEKLEADFAAFLDEKQIKPAQVIHALRVATTGKGVGIGMFETLEILGKNRTVGRLNRRII